MMKILSNCILIALVASLMSCESLFELDLLDNPNAVTPETAGIDFVYNNIQLKFRDIFLDFHFIADGLIRHVANGAFTYVLTLPPPTGNQVWRNAYADLFPDIDLLLKLAEEKKLDIHAGSAKIMKAYVMTTLVDYFGDVPYSNAGQGVDNFSPAADAGASVYAAAEALLDEAIIQLSAANAAKPAFDNYYDGDAARWVTLAKTLKMRMYVNTRLVDGSAGSKLAAIVSEGDFIDRDSEDFQFNFGNQRSNPNTRHPFYNQWYDGFGTYMANYFMWLMCCEKEIVDPRIRFYFYRQIGSIADNNNVFTCHLSSHPDDLNVADDIPHYATVDPNLPYCVASENGYHGRDHGNGSAGPPDNHLVTAYGLYPGGGRFDGDFFEIAYTSRGTVGALGEGIAPIMLSSFVYFMRAEAALTAGSGENARALLKDAVTESIDKVFSFQARGTADLSIQIRNPHTGEIQSIEETYVPTEEEIQKYIDTVLMLYDNAADKLDVVMKEYFIALFGNSIEAYNLYRRTGKPNNMQPGIDFQATDAFPRSLLLPSDHVTLNANVTQKTLEDLVFWDDGSSTVR